MSIDTQNIFYKKFQRKNHRLMIYKNDTRGNLSVIWYLMGLVYS